MFVSAVAKLACVNCRCCVGGSNHLGPRVLMLQRGKGGLKSERDEVLRGPFQRSLFTWILFLYVAVTSSKDGSMTEYWRGDEGTGTENCIMLAKSFKDIAGPINN